MTSTKIQHLIMAFSLLPFFSYPSLAVKVECPDGDMYQNGEAASSLPEYSFKVDEGDPAPIGKPTKVDLDKVDAGYKFLCHYSNSKGTTTESSITISPLKYDCTPLKFKGQLTLACFPSK